MKLYETATKIAWHFLGEPYRWGGNDPVEGFDCSGFVIEILKSVGRLPREGDWTAARLYDFFKFQQTHFPDEGCLAFFKDKGGKSGGGPGTLSLADAMKHDAYIKVRPFRTRGGLYAFVDPFLEVDNGSDGDHGRADR